MAEKNIENNDNYIKLIKSAKREFLEKGFAGASLRNIAADAGMTTGAVYFFFKDKNGLFEGVVGGALKNLTDVLQAHFTGDMAHDFLNYRQQDGDHEEFAKELVDIIYDNYDEMSILLHGAAGSKYENIVDDIINRMNTVYIKMAESFARGMPGKRVNEKMLHWLCHVQVGGFMHMIEHEHDKESAMKFIRPVMDLLVKAWISYALESDD